MLQAPFFAQTNKDPTVHFSLFGLSGRAVAPLGLYGMDKLGGTEAKEDIKYDFVKF